MGSGGSEHSSDRATPSDAAETLVAGHASDAPAGVVTAVIADSDPSWRHREGDVRAPSKPGDRIGEDQRFEILEELGAGGMAMVFRANDRQLDRSVAIKFFLAHHSVSADQIAEMLKLEARATARLAHENIVRIFDMGTWNERPFLVMEYLEGESLTEILYRKRLEIPRAVDILIDVVRGLEHAHGHGILHRDLKPSNVLILSDGRAKILDFGIAQFFGSKAGDILSREGSGGGDSGRPQQLVGTPAYMAPEQWRGDTQDGRADLWAAGVMLFEMLTGQLPPWTRTTKSILAWLSSRDPPGSVRALRADVPEELDAIVLRTMTRDPTARFRSAAELGEALRGVQKSLRGEATSRRPPFPSSTPVGPERRQLTVLASVLSGLDFEGDELDVDDVGELLRAFHELCAEVVKEHGGSVATLVGGKLIACFGYPAAQEDDAQRAVRAALKITKRAAELTAERSHAPLEVRVGVHTGLVIVEAMNGPLDRGIPAIHGEAPDLAARLAERADPDSVVISQATFHLVPGLFATEPLSRPLTGRGGGQKMPTVYQVQRELEVTSRFEQAFGDLTPLVGREGEVDLLTSLWDDAKAGRGHFVLLSGDAGIGKSRMVQVLRERCELEGYARMTCQCWPHFQSSALYPVIKLLLRSAQIGAKDSVPEKIRKLEEALASLEFSLPETVPLVAALLSLELVPPYVPPALTPERQKARTLEAVTKMVIRLAARRPLLFVVEDLHWVDPSTLEFLTLLYRQIASAPILVVVTFRPEFEAPWPEQPHLHALRIERLSHGLAGAMVARAAGARLLPPEMIDELVLKTDGIPLFVEELTRMVLDTMEARSGARALGSLRPGAALASLGIPVTLRELLLARLDRLAGTGKEVAQIGSVLGREFSYRLLDAVSTLDAAALQRGLAQLGAAGILLHEGEPPEAKYLFKHALLQDAAYQSLLKSKRQQHHRTIAAILTERFPEIAETEPELCAHHFGEGGNAEQALIYWERAGARATQRSANIEAISHYQRALDLVVKDSGPSSVKRELGLCIAMGSPLMAIKGYAAPEVEQAYARARELCHLAGEDAQLFPAMAGLWQFYMVGGQIRTSRDLGHELLALAESTESTTFRVLGHRALATSLFLLGELPAAVAHTEKGLALYDAQQHGSLAFRHGHDPGVAHCLYAAWALALLGHVDRALDKANEAIAIAEALAHPLSMAFAYSYAAMIHQIRGEPEATLELAERALPICAEHRFALWLAWATIQRGAARAAMGFLDDGLDELIRGSNGWLDTGARSGMTYFIALRAEVLGREGRLDEALAAIDEGLATAELIGERFEEAELLRQRGDLLLRLAPSDPVAAEATYLRGLHLAREAKARLHELRIATSLSTLLSRTQRGAEARELLGGVVSWFEEGRSLPALTRARSLLDEWSLEA